MPADQQPETPDRPGTQSPDEADGSDQFTAEGLFRVARWFLIPFLLSWMVAYIGGEWGIDWVYYAGLGGVGVSLLGLMLWLLQQ